MACFDPWCAGMVVQALEMENSKDFLVKHRNSKKNFVKEPNTSAWSLGSLATKLYSNNKWLSLGSFGDKNIEPKDLLNHEGQVGLSP